jgi:hypothetical protein
MKLNLIQRFPWFLQYFLCVLPDLGRMLSTQDSKYLCNDVNESLRILWHGAIKTPHPPPTDIHGQLAVKRLRHKCSSPLPYHNLPVSPKQCLLCLCYQVLELHVLVFLLIQCNDSLHRGILYS